MSHNFKMMESSVVKEFVEAALISLFFPLGFNLVLHNLYCLRSKGQSSPCGKPPAVVHSNTPWTNWLSSICSWIRHQGRWISLALFRVFWISWSRGRVKKLFFHLVYKDAWCFAFETAKTGRPCWIVWAFERIGCGNTFVYCWKYTLYWCKNTLSRE